MNLKQRALTTLGVLTLGLSMTSGIAFAQTDTADTVVNVTCPVTSTVDVNVNGQFNVNTQAAETSATLPGGFEVILDLTCNWSDNFQVDATIGQFNYQGTAPSGSAASFSGTALDLINGAGVYAGPTIPFIAGAPDVEANVFEAGTTDLSIIENDTFFFFFDLAAPGVTTATWDGELNDLPLNLAGGQYIAPLTVTLTVN